MQSWSASRLYKKNEELFKNAATSVGIYVLPGALGCSVAHPQDFPNPSHGVLLHDFPFLLKDAADSLRVRIISIAHSEDKVGCDISLNN